MATTSTPSALRAEEACNASEMEASLSTTNKIAIAELEIISRKVYANVPAVMDIPLLQKIRQVLGQEFLDNLIVIL